EIPSKHHQQAHGHQDGSETHAERQDQEQSESDAVQSHRAQQNYECGRTRDEYTSDSERQKLSQRNEFAHAIRPFRYGFDLRFVIVSSVCARCAAESQKDTVRMLKSCMTVGQPDASTYVALQEEIEAERRDDQTGEYAENWVDLLRYDVPLRPKRD